MLRRGCCDNSHVRVLAVLLAKPDVFVLQDKAVLYFQDEANVPLYEYISHGLRRHDRVQ